MRSQPSGGDGNAMLDRPNHTQSIAEANIVEPVPRRHGNQIGAESRSL